MFETGTLTDEEAEQLAIGSIIVDPSIIEEYPLTPKDFFWEELGQIYFAIMVLYGNGQDINMFSVAEKVKELYDEPVKKTATILSRLAEAIVAPMNGPIYAKRVKELSLKRQLLKAITTAEDKLINGEPIETVNATLEKAIAGVTPTEKLIPLAEDFDMDKVRELKKMKVFHTHLTRLNDCVRLTKGELISIVGDTSRGKTQFTLNIVDDVIKQKGKVLYFSIDMDREQLIMRLISMHQMVPLSALKPDNEKFEDYFRKELQDKDYYSRLYEFHKTTDIRSVIHIARAVNPDLVVFDYIQNFRDSVFTNSRAQELTSIMLLLQQEAQRYPVIALSQVSKGTGEMGLLERAKGTSTIGQASSVIIEVDREEDSYKYRIRKNRTWGITTGWIDLSMYYGYFTEL